jgi:hypothetical protein
VERGEKSPRSEEGKRYKRREGTTDDTVSGRVDTGGTVGGEWGMLPVGDRISLRGEGDERERAVGLRGDQRPLSVSLSVMGRRFELAVEWMIE